MNNLSNFTKVKSITFASIIAMLPTNVLAQDGPACKVLRAADLTRVLSDEIGYNSFTANEGDFQISNCNAIGGNGSVSLRMISLLKRPNGSNADRRDILLNRYDPDIPFLNGETVTDTAVSYAEKGDLIFWSSDMMKVYIIDEEPDQMERTRRIAQLVATALGLAAEEVNEVTSVMESN